MSHESAVEEMRRSWQQRAEADRKRAEAEAERKADFHFVWGPSQRAGEDRVDAMFGRTNRPKKQKKAAQAEYNKQAPARIEALRAREQARLLLSERANEAQRELDAYIPVAQRGDLSGIEGFVAVHQRVTALRGSRTA